MMHRLLAQWGNRVHCDLSLATFVRRPVYGYGSGKSGLGRRRPKAPFGVLAHPVTTAGPCSVKRARKTHNKQKSKFDAGIIGNGSARASWM
jgi:hypothetical protein